MVAVGPRNQAVSSEKLGVRSKDCGGQVQSEVIWHCLCDIFVHIRKSRPLRANVNVALGVTLLRGAEHPWDWALLGRTYHEQPAPCPGSEALAFPCHSSGFLSKWFFVAYL